MRSRCNCLQPFDVNNLVRRLDQRGDAVTGTTLCEIGLSVTIKIVRRGIESIRHISNPAFDEVFLVERANAKGNVRFAAGEIEPSRIVDQIDDYELVPCTEAREQRRKDVIAEPGQTRYSDRPFQPGVARSNAPFDRKRALLHVVERLEQPRTEPGR